MPTESNGLLTNGMLPRIVRGFQFRHGMFGRSFRERQFVEASMLRIIVLFDDERLRERVDLMLVYAHRDRHTRQ